MPMGGSVFAGLLVLFLLLLSIMWAALPFILLSINNKLKDLISSQRDTNKHLSDLKQAAQNLATASRVLIPDHHDH